MDVFSRTELLIGKENVKKLNDSKVIVFGVGGVGGNATEALARAGIGNITIVDNDTISLTNINRQIVALNSTIGKYKVDVMKERILDINKNANVMAVKTFYTKENYQEIKLDSYDYVIDAIDTVTSKLLIIKECKEKNIPIISSMGTGNKINPLLFEVDDIFNTSVCPLARVLRKELKNLNIQSLKVVYSKEEPKTPKDYIEAEKKSTGRVAPASISFVPSVAGMIIASEVVKDLINQ